MLTARKADEVGLVVAVAQTAFEVLRLLADRIDEENLETSLGFDNITQGLRWIAPQVWLWSILIGMICCRRIMKLAKSENKVTPPCQRQPLILHTGYPEERSKLRPANVLCH